MWEFSNLNSDSTLWPHDTAQEQAMAAQEQAMAAHAQTSMAYPTSAIPYGCPFTRILFPGPEAHENFLQFSSTCLPLRNRPAPSFKNNSEPEAPETKGSLVFEPSENQPSFVFLSAANPYDNSNSALPARNGTFACSSNSHVIFEDEMHEDTEEIDALLYSESDYINSEEESSTGHSPLDLDEEETASSYRPAKRHRVSSTKTENLLVETASSALSPSTQYIPEDDQVDLSFISCIGNRGENSGCRARNLRSKRKKIQATVQVLRRIIPGGKGKDTASVLDEAIQYLKSLKLSATAVGVASGL